MFMPVIASQGTEEQVEKWMPRSKKHQIIGCYAQTEMAHGSNLSGLVIAIELLQKFITHTFILGNNCNFCQGI